MAKEMKINQRKTKYLMNVRLLTLFIMIAVCKDTHGQQYISGVSEHQTDSIIALIKKQELQETDSFFLAPYKLVDGQTEIINIYSPYIYYIDSIDYSQKLFSHLQFSPIAHDYFLYKKGDNTDSIFAMVGDDGSLAPIIMCNLGYRVLGELKELLSQTDIKHEAIFLLYPTFLHFFVLKNNEVYIFADGKLEKAVSYFQQRYSIEKFRQMLTCQCDPDRPIQKGRTVTPEEIEKLKK